MQYILKDPKEFLFVNRSPEDTVLQVAETAMREIVGRSAIQRLDEATASGNRAAVTGIMIRDILERGRREVEQESLKLLQRVLDDYGSGIQITQIQMQNVEPPAQVIDAFRDVQRAELVRLRASEEVAYVDIAAAKREVLALLYHHFREHHLANDSDRARAFHRFRDERGEVLECHARFEALQDHFRRGNPDVWGWPAWPGGRSPSPPMASGAACCWPGPWCTTPR